MEYTLKDRSFEFSETEVKHEVIKIGESEDGLFEIEFKLTFSYGFLNYSHNFIWINQEIETLLEQMKKMDEKSCGTLSVLSPGVSFAYSKDPHDESLYEFTVFMDTGYINSYMGTESKLGITLTVPREYIGNWITSFIKS
ncbi:hypothetical protein CSV80_06010 [Sporosarcina sp. P12(2017)]|uniref:hypothetical protein n=1 Tax=unclassified Sporosarcina TaxID=2647733 RepID=UPI000C170C83|nr:MULTISPECIES: hypothetical protein [unclassified Sporosarcina]PIC57863.1 hypothetical protein CSV81_06155 [Sporosarcina sp. P10]PIC61245.1 hypothetical protein CSV80_06010 [Sporosarcina sp. P12(2017)]